MSKVGEYNNKEEETNVTFNFLGADKPAPSIIFPTSMETMVSSSLQLCIWKDKQISKKDLIKTLITKGSKPRELNEVDIYFKDDTETSSEEADLEEPSENEEESENQEPNSTSEAMDDKSVGSTYKHSLDDSFHAKFVMIGE